MDKYFKKRKVKTMWDFLGGIIAYPFRWIDTISPNYVVTLILFAVFMKIVLFPFGIKQQKNSIKQANLRPYETIIRKKYAGRNDKISQQKMNQEIMELYQRENFNPAGGCLPMLIQLPILLALYQVITKPLTFLLEMKSETIKAVADICAKAKLSMNYEIFQINDLLKVHNGEIEKLSEEATVGIDAIETLLADPVKVGEITKPLAEHFEDLRESFTVFGINLMDKPEMGNFSILWIVPIMVFVFSFLSMKLTRRFTYQPAQTDNAAAASFKLMDITMPLMSAWISFITPAGIGIYWVIQNVLGVVQQFILYKLYPVPVMTEEDLKLAEKELRGKVKQQRLSHAEKAEPVSRAPGQKPKKHQTSLISKPRVSAHGKKRIKDHGEPPRAIRRP